MKLKSKIYIIAVLGIMFTVGISMYLLKVTIIGYIEKNEIDSILLDYERADALLDREKRMLENIALDWTQWDDAYKFIDNGNSEFIDINLQDSTLRALNINFLIFLDSKGNIVFSNTYNDDSAIKKDFTNGLLEEIKTGNRLVGLLSSKVPTTGILVVSDEPVFVTISGITNSNGNAPSKGLFIIGRSIDENVVGYISKALNLNVSLEKVKKPGLSDMAYNGNGIWILQSNNNINSYSALNDIFGNRVVLLGFNIFRKTYNDGIQAIIYLGFFAFFSLLVIAGVCIHFVNKIIVRRLNMLLIFMENVGDKKDTKDKLYIKGSDEIASLAVHMNRMLEKIDGYFNDIKIGEERFRLVMEAANDGYFDSDLTTHDLYVSNEWLAILGLDERKNITTYAESLEIIHPQDVDKFKRSLADCINGETERMKVEYRVSKSSGDWLWILVRAKVVEYDQAGVPIRLVGTIQDISERKKFEEENLYLSQTDVVTALKNRAFMEELLEKADECENCKSWIVIGDVNGLKIINDSLGHQEGDKLLYNVGNILRTVCSEDDIPARWGGDEFVILIKDKGIGYIQSIINNIKAECNSVIDYPVKISLSLGYAQKDNKLPGLKAVLKAAEERMYRNKLLESQSTRSSILVSLEQSLHEKHIETEEHTKRIEQTCLKIGYKMGLQQAELDELALLGLLHDIGKIGIPEHVLLKPDKLTNEEWDIMKTHSEIGYRIASATPELAHIAEEILSHHERYDGMGYPCGLKGNEIPKLSRLLSIVDSFDVMTHDRHYKKAMSLDDAVEEVKRCSGKQFDPDMVEMFLEHLYEDIKDNDEIDIMQSSRLSKLIIKPTPADELH